MATPPELKAKLDRTALIQDMQTNLDTAKGRWDEVCRGNCSPSCGAVTQ
jgi:hypothetical protein